MFPESWTHDQIIRQGLAEILVNQKLILERQEKQMAALDDLKVAVAKLSTDVNDFIAANTGGATDADLTALTAQVNAIDAVINPPSK